MESFHKLRACQRGRRELGSRPGPSRTLAARTQVVAAVLAQATAQYERRRNHTTQNRGGPIHAGVREGACGDLAARQAARRF